MSNAYHVRRLRELLAGPGVVVPTETLHRIDELLLCIASGEVNEARGEDLNAIFDLVGDHFTVWELRRATGYTTPQGLKRIENALSRATLQNKIVRLERGHYEKVKTE
jgi:hypothetical protein